jgi:hypothetical protein
VRHELRTLYSARSHNELLTQQRIFGDEFLARAGRVQEQPHDHRRRARPSPHRRADPGHHLGRCGTNAMNERRKHAGFSTITGLPSSLAGTRFLNDPAADATSSHHSHKRPRCPRQEPRRHATCAPLVAPPLKSLATNPSVRGLRDLRARKANTSTVRRFPTRSIIAVFPDAGVSPCTASGRPTACDLAEEPGIGDGGATLPFCTNFPHTENRRSPSGFRRPGETRSASSPPATCARSASHESELSDPQRRASGRHLPKYACCVRTDTPTQ